MVSEKQAATDRLTSLLGVPRAKVTGRQAGTVPARVFEAAASSVGIRHRSRTATTEAVIRLAGLEWRSDYDSRESNSEGGGNVTVPGLLALGDALELLLGTAALSLDVLISSDHAGLAPGDPLIAAEASDWASMPGQDRMLDPERRRKVEMAAQEWLMWVFQRDGWLVEDTHLSYPFDAMASRGEETLYLEAKGTTTRGRTVIVTRNEVAWARAHPGQCVLGVWSGMVFDDEDEINPDVGYTTIVPWNPNDEDLDPISYDYRVDWTEGQD